MDKEEIKEIPPWWAEAMRRCNIADKFTPLRKDLTEKKRKQLEKLKKEVKEKK